MGNASRLSDRPQAGVTLVEVLMAVALVGVVMAALINAMMTQQRVYTLQSTVADMTQQAQTAMDLMARELRNAGTNPTGAVFTPVTYSATQLELRTDSNGNGTTTDANEHVMYAYDAAHRQITRDASDGQGPQIVADNIQTCTFAYLDTNGLSTTVSSAIRQVQLTITARAATPDPHYPSNNGYRTYTLTSVITLRN